MQADCLSFGWGCDPNLSVSTLVQRVILLHAAFFGMKSTPEHSPTQGNDSKFSETLRTTRAFSCKIGKKANPKVRVAVCKQKKNQTPLIPFYQRKLREKKWFHLVLQDTELFTIPWQDPPALVEALLKDFFIATRSRFQTFRDLQYLCAGSPCSQWHLDLHRYLGAHFLLV